MKVYCDEPLQLWFRFTLNEPNIIHIGILHKKPFVIEIPIIASWNASIISLQCKRPAECRLPIIVAFILCIEQ